MNRPTLPIILSTWSFGVLSNRAGWDVLERGGSALDAVERGCVAVEDDPTVDSVGRGGLPDANGEVTLDGCVMLSPSRSGGVAGIKHFGNPVSIARQVMERTPHKLLVSFGAERFARECGFKEVDLLTPEARRRWEEWAAKRTGAEREAATRDARRANREEMRTGAAEPPHDTVGVLAIDAHGQLAGACSTSGLPFKLPGRVGDSPIIGHGLYVVPGVGAAVTTGRGELMSGVCAAFLAVERMRAGDPPDAAARYLLHRMRETYPLDSEEDQCGVITLAADGRWGFGALRPGFKVAVTTREGEQLVEAG